eukprot:TRINITY_DN11926_c0_g1_i1.p2 TRINITY_DN11926_c0_g1~~TRINITY_DN11926_c0_g1_i1.p2  ORF type:complete len:87 (-),score=9.93 TRINITY_DN11926_c0_g1_i1:472-732(-)
MVENQTARILYKSKSKQKNMSRKKNTTITTRRIFCAVNFTTVEVNQNRLLGYPESAQILEFQKGHGYFYPAVGIWKKLSLKNIPLP